MLEHGAQVAHMPICLLQTYPLGRLQHMDVRHACTEALGVGYFFWQYFPKFSTRPVILHSLLEHVYGMPPYASRET